jgi:hypothetical protein
VRSGDTAAAKSTLPEKITGDKKWPALEMYFLLKREGDAEGIASLVKALDGEWGTCSRVIRSWHSRNLRRATRLFEGARSDCANHLMPRLMLGRIPVEAAQEAVEAVHRQSDGNAIFEVDRALATWRTNGYAAGVNVLDAIAAIAPEGTPILQRLAEAYLEMDLPEKAITVLGNRESPELLALRILALEAARKKRDAAKLVNIALKRSEKHEHPAYVYFKLRRLLDKKDAAAVQTWIEEHLAKEMYGEWTSEIAELGARALIELDLREDAQDLTQRISKHISIQAGADEAIDVWSVDIDLNVTKGGRHRNRALAIIRTLREEGVKDPSFAYWLGVENITNGSERLGLKFIKEALGLDPAFKPGWAKMAEMEWMGEQTAARMRHVLPHFDPPGAPPPPS